MYFTFTDEQQALGDIAEQILTDVVTHDRHT